MVYRAEWLHAKLEKHIVVGVRTRAWTLSFVLEVNCLMERLMAEPDVALLSTSLRCIAEGYLKLI